MGNNADDFRLKPVQDSEKITPETIADVINKHIDEKLPTLREEFQNAIKKYSELERQEILENLTKTKIGFLDSKSDIPKNPHFISTARSDKGEMTYYVHNVNKKEVDSQINLLIEWIKP